MDSSSFLLWGTIILFGTIGCLSYQDHIFIGEVVGFGVAALAFWVRLKV